MSETQDSRDNLRATRGTNGARPVDRGISDMDTSTGPHSSYLLTATTTRYGSWSRMA